jgi:hypothetical protein
MVYRLGHPWKDQIIVNLNVFEPRERTRSMLIQPDTNLIASDLTTFTVALNDELESLACGPGLEVEPVSQCPHVTYLGHLSKTVGGQPDLLDAEEAIRLIGMHLKDLGDKRAPALSVKLGVTVKGPNPNQRYDAADGIDGLPSRSTIRRIMDRGAVADLSQHLAQVGQGLEKIVAQDSTSARQSYSIDHMQGLFTIGDDRSATCFELTYWVTGRVEEPEPTYLAHGFYGADRTEGAISYRAVFGCTIAEGDSWFENHYAFAKVTFGRPLAQGVRHVFRYALDVHSNEPCAPFLYGDPTTQVGMVDLTIDFGPHRPKRLWTFHQLNHLEANIASCRQDSPVAYDQSRYVTEHFDNIEPGHVSGFTWTF